MNHSLDLVKSLTEFHASLSFRLELLNRARKSLNTYLSQDLRVFSYIAPDENMLSRILKDLLDPDGPHGQGEVFLVKFLERIGHPELSGEASLATARCQTPASCVPEGGLIDITVSFPSFEIGIENKPSAVEQPDQLSRYCRHLDAHSHGRFCMVFWDGRGTAPTSISEEYRQTLEAGGCFKVLSYIPDLRDWLEECIRESKSDKLRWFLRDFAEHVKSEFEAASVE